jgi:FAD/FMN-containing dehydrogenase
MKLSGWGRYPTSDSELLAPADDRAMQACLQAHSNHCIARGAGRSYGDAALSETVVSSRHLDHFIDFDKRRGRIHCAAGLSLDELLRVTMAEDFILPVLPGTRFVSVGGAIAADIHGKNHHQDGCFSAHVESFRLLLANGEIRHCSREENPELFAASCGGMGLTGIILDASLNLHKVPGVLIHNRTLQTDCLEDCIDKLRANADSKYAVAWLDCLARGKQLGRSVLYLGDHAGQHNRKSRYRHESGKLMSVPFSTPGFLLNSLTMRSFNKLYYSLQSRRQNEQLLPYQRYFFPLDRIQNWNRLYGRRGFQQYQLVLPEASALTGIRSILETVSAAGKGSFLAVLKQFGEANDNPLSFPMAGFTLTLDFKMEAGLNALLEQLDAIVLEHGGRLYLAKDARMAEAMFKAGYPRWQEFMQLRRQVDPENKFSSLLSRRLGLDSAQAVEQ